MTLTFGAAAGHGRGQSSPPGEHAPCDGDVVVPTWNGREMLAQCLGALARPSRPPVIVVDNALRPTGPPISSAREFPAVALVELAENVGFGRAVNACVGRRGRRCDRARQQRRP